jgi:hypothetical protein
MCRKSLGILTLLFFLLALRSAGAQQFSADMISTSDSGVITRSKLYAKDGKMRIEFPAQEGVTMLVDAAARTTYIVNATQKTYMDFLGQANGGGFGALFMPIDPDNPCPQWMAMARPNQEGGSCKKIGTENVRGRDTVKLEATSKSGEKAYAWIDPKLHFLIKLGGQGSTAELQNIIQGPQSGIFEVPAGYQKLDLNRPSKNAEPPKH